MTRLLLLSLLLLVATDAVGGPGQQHPDKIRTAEVQSALINKGFMAGPPSGVWDDRTVGVLRKIAQDHGWQDRHVPDARVLILLGLGNKHSDPAVTLNGSNHLDYPKNNDPNQ